MGMSMAIKAFNLHGSPLIYDPDLQIPNCVHTFLWNIEEGAVDTYLSSAIGPTIADTPNEPALLDAHLPRYLAWREKLLAPNGGRASSPTTPAVPRKPSPNMPDRKSAFASRPYSRPPPRSAASTWPSATCVRSWTPANTTGACNAPPCACVAVATHCYKKGPPRQQHRCRMRLLRLDSLPLRRLRLRLRLSDPEADRYNRPTSAAKIRP